MTELMLQFARLWGHLEASPFSAKDEIIAGMMKEYDSEDMERLLTKWANEYLAGQFDDTVEFFEDKISEMYKNRNCR